MERFCHRNSLYFDEIISFSAVGSNLELPFKSSTGLESFSQSKSSIFSNISLAWISSWGRYLTVGSQLDPLAWSLHIFRRARFFPKWKTLTFWPGIKRLHQCQNGERRVLWSSQVHGSKGLCVIFCVSTYRMQKRGRQEGKSSFWYLIKKLKAFILELSRSNRSLANCFVYSILLIISPPKNLCFTHQVTTTTNMQSPFFSSKLHCSVSSARHGENYAGTTRCCQFPSWSSFMQFGQNGNERHNIHGLGRFLIVNQFLGLWAIFNVFPLKMVDMRSILLVAIIFVISRH